ncbi:MAG: hypothetical protein ACNI3C_02920 [Candidatus Marinarcus sp.]|uniref:hypothetical protein n=1 Tax=Candidatus Marinarcus sp. TaxID=3100987 RepID=UPI003B00C46E
MNLDLLLPFGIIVALVVYLIFSRNKFEKSVLDIYEAKFEEWKKHNSSNSSPVISKELVGLIFKENGKINIELINKEIKSKIEKGKFEIKE